MYDDEGCTTTIWLDWLDFLIQNGCHEAPRGMATRALYNAQLTFNPSRPIVMPIGRKLSYRFMFAEAYWILTGDDTVAGIAPYNDHISQFSDDGVKFFGAYGPKILDQLQYVVRCLRDDPQSRQAGINIWRDSPPKTKDVPCTLLAHFRLEGKVVYSHVVMRSSDVWLGLPYDVFNFSMLQNFVALLLGDGYSVGDLTYTLFNTHIYERNLEDATKLLVDRRREARVIRPQPIVSFNSPGALLATLRECRDASTPLEHWMESV